MKMKALQNQQDTASKSSSKSEVYSDTGLSQETRENLKKTYHLKELEKEEKAQSQQKKRNNTDQRRDK